MSAGVAAAHAAVEYRGRPWGVFLIVAADVLALETSLFLGYLTRIFFPVPGGADARDFANEAYIGLVFGVLAIPLAYWILDLYPGYGLNPVERLRRRIQATLSVFSILLFWDYMVQGHQWSRGIMAGTAIFAMILPPLAEEIVRYSLARRGWIGMPTMVLGAGETGRHVVRHLLQDPGFGFLPTVVLDNNYSTYGDSVDGVRIAGPISSAPQYRERIYAVIVAMPELSRGELRALLSSLPFPRIIYIPDWGGLQTLWITARDLGGVLGLEVNRNLLIPANHSLKRVLDLTLAVPLFLAAIPLVAIFALLITILSPGAPAFFYHSREGAGGKPLRMLKLRTMQPDAEKRLQQYLAANADERDHFQRHFKLRHDPRIIPGIGKLLRRFSLDELPQLWHVLRGEMSLVGPRPFPHYHLEAFTADFRAFRRSVTPGLTGLWQVTARSDGDVGVQEALDTYYIRNWSPWLDLHILIRTVRVVLLGKGAY